MTKEQKQLAIIAGMLPFLILAIISGMGSKKKRVTFPGPGPEYVGAINPPSIAPPSLPTDKNTMEAQKKRSEGAWGRDPFISDVYKSGQANSELKLQGISYRKDDIGFAFINNEIVKKGDSVGGYEVAQILKDRVLLKKGSQSFYLAFPEE